MPIKIIRESLAGRRILLVSDIHGNFPLFRELLEKMEYQAGQDALVILGDLIEKGRENLKTLRFVMELQKKPFVYVLRGNCDQPGEDEDRLLQYLTWFKERTLFGEMAKELGVSLPQKKEELAAFQARLRDAFPKELSFLQALPHILETPDYLFAHAGLSGEALSEESPDFVLSTPLFGKLPGKAFPKLLVVGHYPTANYRENCLDNSPYYNEQRNVLSIDGGNVVKTAGELNGVILENSREGFSWTYTDSYQKIAAPCAGEAAPGIAVMWPNHQVEPISRGEEFSQCRVKASGTLVEIPNDLLFQREGNWFCLDMTNCCLAVKKGETVSLIKEYSDRLMILKDGKVGFLFKA